MARTDIEIDDHELRELDLDLRAAPLRIRWNTESAVRYAGREIDQEMTQDARGHEGNIFGRPGTQFDIGLDRHVSHELIDPLTVEVGIENEGSGSIGHIVAFGSVKNAPAYDPYAGPERAMPRILRRLAEGAEDAALGRDIRP